MVLLKEEKENLWSCMRRIMMEFVVVYGVF
jgi:hypothetical protein